MKGDANFCAQHVLFFDFLPMTMMEDTVKYHVNEEINIIGGIYKRYKRGIYKGEYGEKMCSVQMKSGNGTFIRNIRLTSIAKRPINCSNQGLNEQKLEADDITISKEEYQKLLNDMEGLKVCINELESTLKRLRH